MRDSVDQMRFPRPCLPRLAAVATLSALVLVACGSDTIDNAADTTPDSVAGTENTLLPVATKPTVQIPSKPPTELVITDLTEGTGEPAKEGDTVLIHYVGVRSVDGTEFDNNYGSDPIEVVLGSHGVIEGWETGLIGVKTGGRRQLDIPNDLAYGDQDKGDIIKAGDALSFVLDIDAVVSVGDPADAPDITVTGAANREKIDIQELVKGDGPVAQSGQLVAVQIIAFRADTGEKISSTWEQGAAPFYFKIDETGILPGVQLAVDGMAVGGRRQVAVPYLLAFGEDGNPDFGLPAKTDMVLIVDMVAVY
jgi:peptidylprolyl isomerase